MHEQTPTVSATHGTSVLPSLPTLPPHTSSSCATQTILDFGNVRCIRAKTARSIYSGSRLNRLSFADAVFVFFPESPPCSTSLSRLRETTSAFRVSTKGNLRKFYQYCRKKKSAVPSRPSTLHFHHRDIYARGKLKNTQVGNTIHLARPMQ